MEKNNKKPPQRLGVGKGTRIPKIFSCVRKMGAKGDINSNRKANLGSEEFRNGETKKDELVGK